VTTPARSGPGRMFQYPPSGLETSPYEPDCLLPEHGLFPRGSGLVATPAVGGHCAVPISSLLRRAASNARGIAVNKLDP
jgi:hypothetical protein